MTARDHRPGLLDELGRAIADTSRECPILQALHVGCAAFAIGATQEEIDTATPVSDPGDGWEFCDGPWCGKPIDGGKCILWPRHDGECARYVGP